MESIVTLAYVQEGSLDLTAKLNFLNATKSHVRMAELVKMGSMNTYANVDQVTKDGNVKER